MDHLNLEQIDVDGTVREAAEAVAGDTRLNFLRKGAVAGGAAIGGGAILSALIPGSAMAASGTPPTKPFGKGDIGILNYALTLEFLERGYYEEAQSKGIVTDSATKTFLGVVVHDEKAHVAFLKKALGRHAIKEPSFDFSAGLTSQSVFQATAYALENTGVHAYLGQAGNISNAKYLLAAASIVTIEARHAGAIGSITGKAINPNGAFDNGYSASKVLKIVGDTKFVTKL